MTAELIAEAELGEQAEAFMESDLGRYFVGCCDQEIESAQERLKVADPENARVIRQLQNDIWRAESAKRWFAELIAAGKTAIEVLRDEQEKS